MGYVDSQEDKVTKDIRNLSPRISLVLFLGLVAVASARIAATYTVFNDTVDEPEHIACGMQWLDQKVYQYVPDNLPLVRVMVAMGRY